MPTLVLLLVMVALGAALQGSVGIGLGLFAAPFVALLAPQLIPGPMLAGAFVLTLLIVARDRRAVDLRGMSWALMGRVPGAVVGAFLVSRLEPAGLQLALGAMILLCVGLSASRWRPQPHRGTLVAAGFVSGITGTTTSVGGPPVALVYQNVDGPRLRATMSGYFVVATSLSLALLAGVGKFGRAELSGTLLLLPAIGIGFLVSGHTAPLFDRGFTRPAVLLVSGGAATLVLIRGVLTLWS